MQPAYSRPPIHTAAIRNNVQGIQSQLENGVDVNLLDSSRTPLHTAAKYGAKDAVEYLISHGATINARDRYNRTPLHYVASEDSLDINQRTPVIHLLWDHGANLNAKDINGNTPLHLAVQERIDDSVLSLLGLGADTQIINNEGKKAIDLLSRNNDNNIRDMFNSPPPSTATPTRIGQYQQVATNITTNDSIVVNGGKRIKYRKHTKRSSSRKRHHTKKQKRTRKH